MPSSKLINCIFIDVSKQREEELTELALDGELIPRHGDMVDISADNGILFENYLVIGRHFLFNKEPKICLLFVCDPETSIVSTNDEEEA